MKRELVLLLCFLMFFLISCSSSESPLSKEEIENLPEDDPAKEISASETNFVGKGYYDLSDEQKRAFWGCWINACHAKLKKAHQSKNYGDYMDCSKSCFATAEETTIDFCEDSDGLDYKNKGVVTTDDYLGGSQYDCVKVGDKYKCSDNCYTFSNGKEYLIEMQCNPKAAYVQKSCAELGNNYVCEKGACLENTLCKEVIEGHNKKGEKRINIVFIGRGYESTTELFSVLEKVVDYTGDGNQYDIPEYNGNLNLDVIFGLLGVEPYKSNAEAFNLWYVDQLYPETQQKDYCYMSEKDVEPACPISNQYLVYLCNYHTKTAGLGGGHTLSFSEINEGNKFETSAIGLINHEMGHSLGELADVAYPSLYGTATPPNCASTIKEAQNWWGDLIGKGCGDDGIIDCLETCYIDGTCDAGEYQTEVQYITVTPDDCFENGKPVYGCSLDLVRREAGEVEIIDKHISFKALNKDDCEISNDNCMFIEDQQINCFDKKIPRKDLCENLIDKTKYNKLPEHDKVGGCTFKPHLVSIMKSSLMPKYGLVNERQLCNTLQQEVGVASEYCVSKFG